MAETTKQQLLRKAVELIGDQEVAILLGVPSHLLNAWISGHASMPDRKLLLLTDLLGKQAEGYTVSRGRN